MKKSSAAVVTAAILLLLTGCASGPDAAPSEAQGADTSAKSAPKEAPEPVESAAAEDATPANISAPGEVCDPGNMNDPICAAFYPDQVVLNVTARTPEVAALPDVDKIAAAHQACTDPSVAQSFITAGQLAYCPEQLDPQLSLTIAYYQGLGEEGAKADFADKTMPTAAEIGL